MLQDRIDNDEHYRILIDSSNPLRIVLATQAMLRAADPWNRSGTARRATRGRWTRCGAGWRSVATAGRSGGQLAESLGRPAFYAQMRERMEIEPPAECIGTMVTRMDDAREIAISESMHCPQGLFHQPL